MARFSDEVIRLAQKSESDYGVPASVTLAQWAYESGWGTSGHAKNHNNYFGMKYRNGAGNSDATKSYMSRGSKWQEYSSMAQSFDDHGRVLSSEKYSALTKDAKTVDEYIDAFADTYAPPSENPTYKRDIKSIIRTYNLTQYDGAGLSGTPDTDINIALNQGQGETVEIIGTSNDSPSYKDFTIFEPEYWNGVLGLVIKFLVIAGFAILAFIFVMKSFNIKIPTSKKDIVKMAVDKATEEATE